MASIQKTATGYRVQMTVMNKRDSCTFDTRKEAQLWAARREIEMRALAEGREGSLKSMADLFRRYDKEVSSKKAGARWEAVRLKLFGKSLGSIPLSRLDAPKLVAWRDARLRQVSASSVRREMNLISHCLTIAVKEWHWLPANPLKEVSRPPEAPPRTRTYSSQEIERIQVAAGTDVGTVSGRVGLAFLFALETGMRAGEICALTWDRVHPNYVHVDKGKTVASRRDVPLSKKAVDILNTCKGISKESVFALTSAQLDATFRKITSRAMVDAVFHDTRHSAATRIARLPGVDVLSLCRMFGWGDVKKSLLYFNPTASDLAAKLD